MWPERDDVGDDRIPHTEPVTGVFAELVDDASYVHARDVGGRAVSQRCGPSSAAKR
jgi:hypothetical protein